MFESVWYMGNGVQPIINFVMACEYVCESLVFKITFGITLHIL